MELVAASRLRRAQARIEALRPYADRMQALTVEVAAATSRSHDQPLLERRDVSTVAVIALTADRGLAGGFNANVVRRSLEVGVATPRRRPRRRLAHDRPARDVDAALPRPGDRDLLHRHHRPARLLRRAGDRRARRGALHGAPGRSGRDRLQPLRLGARAEARGRRAAAGARDLLTGETPRDASRAPTWRSPTRARSCRTSCRPISR